MNIKDLYKGKKIKLSDKYLRLKFSLYIFSSFIFLYVFYSLYKIKDLDYDIVEKLKIVFINRAFYIVVIIGILIVGLIFYLVYRYREDYYISLEHREILANLILSYKMYDEIKTKDIFGNNSVKKVNVLKVYYKMKGDLIEVYIRLKAGRDLRQILNLENDLEVLLFGGLLEKENLRNYVKYTFLYDTINSRIGINDCICENGKLKLMDNIYWEYDSLPHMLISGGTGSGKSYFILSLVKVLLDNGSKLYICDPKRSDLADLADVMPDVYSTKDEIISCIEKFYDDMLARADEIKALPNYKTGEKYSYYGLNAKFLVFDEYVAFMMMLGRESTKVMNYLSQIAMLGRQLGHFVILACQRPDAQYLSGGIRDQFNFRVALGRNSNLGYGMMFGETDKYFFQKRIKGRGYVDKGDSVISEFYTPLIPQGYNFLEEIGNAYKKHNVSSATDEECKSKEAAQSKEFC